MDINKRENLIAASSRQGDALTSGSVMDTMVMPGQALACLPA
jgi:hypothetical protein